MSTVPLEIARAKLDELISQLQSGDELIITKDNVPVARLLPAGSAHPQARKLGTLHGHVTHMASDFDAPLEDFRDYNGALS
jgi:prevent-host-death family protein